MKHSLFLYYYLLIIVLLFVNYCIIFHTNNCKPTFVPPCIFIGPLDLRNVSDYYQKLYVNKLDRMKWKNCLENTTEPKLTEDTESLISFEVLEKFNYQKSSHKIHIIPLMNSIKFIRNK